jgi:hypothetical protein
MAPELERSIEEIQQSKEYVEQLRREIEGLRVDIKDMKRKFILGINGLQTKVGSLEIQVLKALVGDLEDQISTEAEVGDDAFK